jgi:hypothetical protein
MSGEIGLTNKMNTKDYSYEWFEHEQELARSPKMPPLTQENICTLAIRTREKIDALYAKYIHGGSSPRNTYADIAQKYTDVDQGYAQFINE